MSKKLESYIPDFVAAYAKLNNCFCLFLSLQSEADIEDRHEVRKAAPYLATDEVVDLILSGWLVVECTTFKEMNSLYEKTIGDDGPTKANSYDGKFRIYALTISPDGMLTENT